MSFTSDRMRAKKANKLHRRIVKQAKNHKPQWWHFKLAQRHVFPGTLVSRSQAYVKASTPHEAMIMLKKMGADGDMASAKALGNADSRWRLNVPLSAAWAVWLEA